MQKAFLSLFVGISAGISHKTLTERKENIYKVHWKKMFKQQTTVEKVQLGETLDFFVLPSTKDKVKCCWWDGESQEIVWIIQQFWSVSVEGSKQWSDRKKGQTVV